METNTNTTTATLDCDSEQDEAYQVNMVQMHVSEEAHQLWGKWSKAKPSLPKDIVSFTGQKAVSLQRLLDDDKCFFPAMVNVDERRHVFYSLLGVTKDQGAKVVVASVFEGSEEEALRHHMQVGVQKILEFVKKHEFSGVFG